MQFMEDHVKIQQRSELKDLSMVCLMIGMDIIIMPDIVMIYCESKTLSKLEFQEIFKIISLSIDLAIQTQASIMKAQDTHLILKRLCSITPHMTIKTFGILQHTKHLI
eukprot:c3618_g1_i1.p2 GENE.c3618_g1_i1~~c3618_g1_i1.p2  ORF type:complete len:108 (+),score=10.16 c3618_g1_i1:71-394(+)